MHCPVYTMGSSTPVLLLLLVLPLCWAQTTYYVTPTPETPCPGEPCHTLSEYVAQVGEYFTSSATFMFLSGNHALEKSVSILEQTNLSLIGDSSSLPQVTSRIVCSQPASINFYNVSNLVISSLAFISCGKSDTGPAVMVNLAPHAKLTNCLFQNNKNMNHFGSVGGVLAFKDSSSIVISESAFIGNTIPFTSGGGIYLLLSSARLTGNSFLNNICSGWGGGVYSEMSTVTITDSTFINNTASYGGAIQVYKSSVSVTSSTLMDNTAGKWGGGVDLFESDLVFFSNNTFLSNLAHSGGGLSISESDATITITMNVFSGNHADNKGGGGLVYSGNVTFRENSFINNCADYNGAGVFVGPDHFATVTITQNSFINNSGGGWAVFTNSTYTTNLFDNTFVNNTGNVLYGSSVNNATTYYIAPTVDTPCTEQPCLTLSECVQQADQYFTSNMTLVFLPGNHTLENGLLIANISSLTLIGSPTIQGTSNIICARPTSFLFLEIREVYISSLGFISCGDGSNAALNFYSIYVANIFNCIFQNNSNTYRYGGNGGALNISDSNLTISDCKFMDNSATIGGGICIHKSVVNFINDSFVNNTANHAGGGVGLYNSSILFQNTILDNNTAKYGGAMIVSLTEITFDGVLQIWKNKAIYGAGIYANSIKANVDGNSTFGSNTASTAGGAIYAENSCLHFNGTTSFVTNSAVHGGGLHLSSDSKCYFHPMTTMYFIGNSARGAGGAIDVQDSNPLVNCPDSAVSAHCFFQIVTDELIFSESQVRGLNISISFENNTATSGGSDVYGGAIDTCNFDNFFSICQGICDIGSSGEVFDVLAGSVKDVTSDPVHICFCNSNNTCKADSQNLPVLNVSIYPGTTLDVPVLTLGQRGGRVPAVIQTEIPQSKITLLDAQKTQQTSRNCTVLHYTVMSSSPLTLIVYPQGPCPRESRSLSINIDILQCPHGFELFNEACVCHHRLKQYTNTCSIDKEAVFRPRDAFFWVGYSYENGSQGLIVHPHCPFYYCVLHETFVVVDNASVQCNHGRTGKLCGECKPNLSIVLGSIRCLHCSNTHLALLVAFAFAGIALVIFLFILKLTVVVGTINGLIFYANIVQINADIVLPPGNGNILTVFIAWLNLDLGIETCFYNGMDTYVKTWLQFLFPIYVWILVGIIIIFSHYSQKIASHLGNNPIAVLATLFLLSYAKILRTITAALAVTYLEYPDGERAVWSYDGNLIYFNSKHGLLILAALLSLLFLFLPYTLLLFFGQWFQAKSNWKILSWISKPSVKIFLDAYHAPYTDKHRYWTGLLLLLRFILFLIFILNSLGDPSVNLLSISSAAVGIIAVGFLTETIYKNWYLSALEVSFIVNLGILASATYHVSLTGGNQAAVAYTSIGIAFATFIGICIYHIFLQMQNTSIGKRLIESKFNIFKRKKLKQHTFLNTSQPSIIPTYSSAEFREPLIDESIFT